MTVYLLDTNVVSELRKPKPHGAVIAWIDKLKPEQLRISAVTLGEIQRGIERTRRNDRAKAREIELWVDQIEATQNVVPMDGRCFREWARLMEGKADHLLEDAMIAAMARVWGLDIATRNERDFAIFEVRVTNPFHAAR